MTNPAAAPAPGRFAVLLESPFAAFFLRESTLILRGRNSAMTRALTVILSVGVVLLTAFAGRFGPSVRLGLYAFYALMAVNACAAFILLNGSFSTTISGLREAGTLDLLRTSALSPLELLLGLSSSQFAQSLLLLAIQFPLACYCVTLGGLHPGMILATYALLGAVLYFLCHAGMLWSLAARTSRQASAIALFTVFFFYLLPYLFSLPARANDPFLKAIFFPATWLAQQNPFTAFFSITSGQGWPLASILVHLIVGTLLLRLAVRHFEAICERREAGSEVSRTPLPAKIAPGRLPPPRLQGSAFTWREYYFVSGGPRARENRWIAYIFGVVPVAFFSLAASNSFPFLLVGLAGLWLEATGAAEKLFGEEIRQRTLGDLAILPISPWRLAYEKARGHVSKIAAPLIFTVIGILFSHAPWGQLLSSGYLIPVVILVLLQSVLLLLMTVRLSFSHRTNANAFSTLALVSLDGLCAMYMFLLPAVFRVLVPFLLSVAILWNIVRTLPDAFDAKVGQ